MKRIISCLAVLSVALLTEQASASQSVRNRLRQVDPKGLDANSALERSQKPEYKVPTSSNQISLEIPNSIEKKRA